VRSACAPAPLHLRSLVPERRVRERLQRVVQRGELTHDRRVALACIESAVQGAKLVTEAIKALEQRVELAVTKLLSLHRARF
jgi:hypothetical protein